MNPPAAQPHILGVIPARWASSRFPGKPLHPLLGKPLLQHVFERVQLCQNLSSTVIATDDQRIADIAQSFGAPVSLTSPHHPTGTDRIAETANFFPQATHIINIQGDEPLIEPARIDQLARDLTADPTLEMVTAAAPLTDSSQLPDPNIVKVVLNEAHEALYFSRSPIPHFRSGDQPTPHPPNGLYGNRADIRQPINNRPPPPHAV
ncbi:MAG: 3-deoxy-manno-octulosonate cytidylyltransferase, partial [Verrucomicrobiota bacterium]